MRKYWVKTAILAVLSALLLTGTALAAGTEEEPEPTAGEEGTEETGELENPEQADVVNFQEEEPESLTVEYIPQLLIEENYEPTGIVTLMATEWQSGWIRYGDQLTGLAGAVYQDMERTFGAKREIYESTSNGYRTMFYQDITIEARGASEAAALNEFQDSERFQAHIDPYWNTMSYAAYAFTYDHPEYFWIRTSVSVSAQPVGQPSIIKAGNEYVATMKMHFGVGFTVDSHYTEQRRQQYETQINASAENILSQCNNMSTLAKLAYFDNWLAEKNNYNRAAGDTQYGGYISNYLKNVSDRPWNITSALLLDESPVCEGYAKSFQLLCHRIGVPCVTISGSGHMWNAVQVNGKWYYVDSTHNDPIYTDGSFIDYSNRSHFLVANFSSDSQNHVVNQEFVTPPIASSGYFATPGWSLANQTVSGYRDGTAADCWMALYAAGGKMLEVKPCESIRWGEAGTRVLPPEFSSGTLSQAFSGKTFQVNTNAWSPLGAAETFPQ